MINNVFYLKTCFSKMIVTIHNENNEKMKSRKSKELWINKVFSQDPFGFTIAFKGVFSEENKNKTMNDLNVLLEKRTFQNPLNIKVIWNIPSDHQLYFKGLTDVELDSLYSFVRNLLSDFRKK